MDIVQVNAPFKTTTLLILRHEFLSTFLQNIGGKALRARLAQKHFFLESMEFFEGGRETTLSQKRPGKCLENGFTGN